MEQAISRLIDALAFRERLSAAEAPGPRERSWLEDAAAILDTGGLDELLLRAASLAEADGLRGELVAAAREGWLAAAEELHAGLVRRCGGRAPILEALFPHADFASLRRKKDDALEAFAAVLGKNLHAAYVERTLAAEELSGAALEERIERWRKLRSPPAIEDAEAIALREELVARSSALALPLEQARRLAEAALLGDPDRLEAVVGRRKKRR